MEALLMLCHFFMSQIFDIELRVAQLFDDDGQQDVHLETSQLQQISALP